MKKINGFKLTLAALCLAMINGCISEEVQNLKKDDLVVNARGVKLPNRGFVKNPSEEIKKHFPMCDDFLNVEWLDKENGFGYVEHDLYKDGSMIGHKKSLVYIHGNQADHMFNLERFGQLEPVLEAIKKGKKFYSNLSTIPAVEYKDTNVFFEHYDYTDESYADHHQNVCIPYPDNKRMWLVELRFVENVFSPTVIEAKVKKVEKNFPTMTAKYLMGRGVVDINHDGLEDYLTGEVYIFSTGTDYKSIVKLGHAIDDKGKYYLFGIKDTEKLCKIYKVPYDYLTTDGKNYFLGNECNLTQLSTY